ncbi:MAG TPA: outer membrane lipoprotein carrier protein LolA [Bacteroidales bacterium]|nr:outer membrane lipoprotein carrier protein LolA [Bacteroidales bacterium]
MTHTLHITALTILLSLSASLHAQSPDVLRGKEILEQVSRKTKAYTSIKADFSFTLDNKQAQITDTHKGSILIKGDKYKAEIMGAETYFDGQNTYMYMTDINEVNISGPEMLDEEDSLNPATVFSIFEHGHRYLHAGETTINGKTVDIVDLFPEERNKPYSRIKLYIYQHNQQFAKIEQIGKDGTNYIIDIHKMETNLPVNDSDFTFDPAQHPGIEIIDLR